MKHYAVLTLALLLLSLPVIAQETAEPSTAPLSQTYQPDVTGSLFFGVGVNGLTDAPAQFDINNWGSKSVRIYYLYDINIGSSKFSFHPGIGLGLEKYELDGPLTLTYANVPGVVEEVLILDSLQDVFSSGLYKKNRLAANYVDVPLEISWVSNKTNPKSGFQVALGGKIGVLYSAHTKVKYEVGDETRKIKVKRDFNLNPFRYAAILRVGYSSFNIFAEYQFSGLFDAGDGPLYRTVRDGATPAPFNSFPDDMKAWRIGLALELF